MCGRFRPKSHCQSRQDFTAWATRQQGNTVPRRALRLGGLLCRASRRMSSSAASDAVSGASESAASVGAHVTEGKATIYFPSEKGVFYNPPQIPNRDLSVLALREFAKQWQQEAAVKASKVAERTAAKAASATETKDAAAAEAAAAAAAAAAEAAAAPPSGIRVLDAMTASGLRALRYVLEVPEVRTRS